MLTFLIDYIVANSGINLNNLTILSSANNTGTVGDIVRDSEYIFIDRYIQKFSISI